MTQRDFTTGQTLTERGAPLRDTATGKRASVTVRRTHHTLVRMLTLGLVCLLGLLFLLNSAPGRAEGTDRQQMKGLDEQVQEIKSDVLGISAELGQLEEKLLYPSGTQVAVFVALAPGDQTRLDAVRIQIDGQLVAHYIYSFKELDALRKGGVQRLYVGNLPTGSHKLEVQLDGKLPGGADYSRSEQFSFDKGVEPKQLGLTLAGPDAGRAAIELGNW
jgi:hypothetical protein